MKPNEEIRNGADEGGDGSDSESGSEGEGALWVEDTTAPARALAALNALRKARQHYDVVLVAGGAGEAVAEVPAHGALLAAASPALLAQLPPPAPAAPPQAPPPDAAVRVPGVAPDALHALVDFVYTGRLCARDAAAARRLYRAAWRLRLEAPRLALADRLVRRLAPQDCLDTRALPDLPPHHRATLDAYIADHFDELCSNGAMAVMPLVRIELLRASSADGGEEAPLAVAEAALAWLRDHAAGDSVEELCARTHLVFVDAVGALRDCGELPAARGDAPELQEYRRAAERRGERATQLRPSQPPSPLPGLEVGARRPANDCAVLAARGASSPQGHCRVTRALLELNGALLAARIAWRDVGGEGGAVAVGGPLGGARDAEGGARRAALGGGRCAHGAAVLGGRLLVCGGYDRARVLRSAEAYDPLTNEWAPLPDMRTARARFPAARLGERVYVLGGSDGHTELDSVDVYSVGAGWAAATRLPLAASHAAAAAHEEAGALYVVGGWAGGRSLRAVHRYSPATDSWSSEPPLLTGRSQCAGVVWEGALWALGGCDAWHCLASTERLVWGAAGWAGGAALPTARRSVGGAVWRGRLVSAGGSDGATSLRRVDWLLPHSPSWRALPDLRRARAALTLHVLHDVLYAVGGFDGKEFLSCVECLHDPEGEWTSLCAPPPPRAPPTTTDSEDGATSATTENNSEATAATNQDTQGHKDDTQGHKDDSQGHKDDTQGHKDDTHLTTNHKDDQSPTVHEDATQKVLEDKSEPKVAQ